MQTLRAMTVIQVSDPERSVAFYTLLGFATLGVWGDPPGVANIQRGGVTLMLQLADEVHTADGRWSAYIYTDDVEAMHADLTASGVTLDGTPQDTYYGCRDFSVTDPDGHCFAFGTDLSKPPYANGVGPNRGRG